MTSATQDEQGGATTASVLERLNEAERLVDSVLLEDPDCFSGADAAVAVRRLNRLSRKCVAGEAMFARRVEETKAYRRSGHRDAASWYANATGEPVGRAAGRLTAARRMKEQPKIADAFRAGKLSPDKAQEASAAAAANPAAEQELVDAAGRTTFRQFQQVCDQTKRAATAEDDANTRRARQHANRSTRRWTDREGMVVWHSRFTPDVGALLDAILQGETDRIIGQARRLGLVDGPDACRADALAALVGRGGRTAAAPDVADDEGAASGQAGDGDGGGPSNGHRGAGRTANAGDDGDGPVAVQTIVRVDAAALVRGRLKDGEICEIAGVGSVSLATARRLMGMGVADVVIRRGVDIVTVCGLGRSVPRALRLALVERDPVCCVPGCDWATDLEIHHRVTPFADGGPTSLDNLARVCRPHHDMATYSGWRLEGRPGAWEWRPGPRRRPPPPGAADTHDDRERAEGALF